MHYLFIKIAHDICRQINCMSRTATKLSAIGVSAIRKIMRRKHNSVLNVPTDSSVLEALVIPDDYKICIPHAGVQEILY